MKTLLFWSGLFGAAVALQGLAAPAAYSEAGEKERGMMGVSYLERLTDKLDLSEAQQKKVKSIIAESQPEMEKLHAEMKAVGAKMKAAMRKTREAIRETLDMEQKEKFDALSVKMRMMHHGHGQAEPERGPKRIRPQEGDSAPPADMTDSSTKSEWMEPQKEEGVEPQKAEREPEKEPAGE